MLYVAFTLVMLSGLLISHSVLPALGLQGNRNFLWCSPHDLTANLTLFLAGLHIALNWEWVTEMMRRSVFKLISGFRRMRKPFALTERNPHRHAAS